MRVIVRFNGDGQGDEFRYQVDTRWVCFLDPPEELSIQGNMLFVVASLKGYSARLSWETCSYYSLKLTGKDDI